jgi:MHS family proline/betaine transporter-like MFS transporter
VFEAIQKAGATSGNRVAEAVRLVPWNIVHASVLVVLVGGGFYTLFIWWPTLLSRYVHPHIPQAMALNTAALVLLVILIPITGRLSDVYGRRPMLVLSTAGMAVLSWPLLMLVSQGSVPSVVIAQLCFTVLMSIYLGPLPATLVEMVPARVRFSAIGIAYNISLCVFGGTAPLVATWLVKRYHTVSAPGLYLTCLAALNLVAALALPDPATQRRRGIVKGRPGSVTAR